MISKVLCASGNTATPKDVSVESVLVSQIKSLTLCLLSLSSPFFYLTSFSVTDHILHAAVSSLCDAQPGRLHPLLSERSAGQLAGRLSAGETTWILTLPQKRVI